MIKFDEYGNRMDAKVKCCGELYYTPNRYEEYPCPKCGAKIKLMDKGKYLDQLFCDNIIDYHTHKKLILEAL